MTKRATVVLGVVAVCAWIVAAYPLTPSGLPQAVLYDGIALVAAVVAFAAAMLRPAVERRPYRLIGAGFIAFFIGDVIWDIYELGLDQASPVPSLADVAYTGGYLCLISGAVSLLRRRGRQDLGGPLLDAGIVGVAMAILCWEPILLRAAGSSGEAFVLGIYPVGDMVLLALFSALVLGRRVTVAGALLVTGTAALAVADVGFLVMTRSDSYSTGDWPDLLWMLAPLTIASAPLALDAGKLLEAPPARYERMVSIVLACAALMAVPINLASSNASVADQVEQVALRVILVALVVSRLLRLALREERTEDTLATTSTQLMTVVEHSTTGVIYTALDGTVMEWNTAAERLFGFRRTEMVGENLLDHFGLRQRSTLWREDSRVNHDVVPLELRGGTAIVSFTREAVRRRGRTIGYVVFAADVTRDMVADGITEASESEELRPLMERLGEVLRATIPFDVMSIYAIDAGAYRELVTLDAEVTRVRRPQWWRTSAARVSTATLRRLNGQPVFVLNDTSAGDDDIARFVLGIGGLRSAILVPLRRKNTVHSVFVVGFRNPRPITTEHTGLAEAVAPMLSRAVRRVLVIEHEREALRRLEEIETVRAELLRLFVRDVNAPKGAVARAAAALDSGEPLSIDEARTLTVALHSSVRQLTDLARDLVDVFRGDHGGFPCDATEINDVNSLLHDAAMAAASDRALDVRISVDVDEPVYADRLRLEYGITNLIVNACAQSAPGTPVDVRAWINGDRLRVSVQDQGLGVPPQDARQLFGQFPRSSAADGPVPGTSVSMYITGRIVEAHGGTITIEPTAGGGNTVQLSLPVDARDAARQADLHALVAEHSGAE